jgi:hypothetical protein
MTVRIGILKYCFWGLWMIVFCLNKIQSQSKRFVDIEISKVITPIEGDTLIRSTPFMLKFVITNLGPDTIRSNDKFSVSCGFPISNSPFVSGAKTTILNFNKNLDVYESDTIEITPVQITDKNYTSRWRDFCVKINWIAGRTLQDTIVFDNIEKMRYCFPIFYINPDDFYEPEDRIIDLEVTAIIYPHPYDTLHQNFAYSPITFVLTNLGPDSLSQLDRVDFRLWLGRMSNSAFWAMFNKPLGVNQSDTFQSQYKSNGRMIKDTIKIDYCVSIVKIIGDPSKKPIRKETFAMQQNNKNCVDVIYINHPIDETDTTIVEDSIVQNTGDTTYFNLYPIPAKDILYIQLGNENPKLLNIELVNIMGKSWKPTFHLKKEKLYFINVSDYASGIYFIKIKLKHEVVIKKIVIE